MRSFFLVAIVFFGQLVGRDLAAQIETESVQRYSNPAIEFEAAAIDAKRQPASDWRYVSLIGLDEDQKQRVETAVNMTLAHCSRAFSLHPVERVSVTLHDDFSTELLRFDGTLYNRPENRQAFNAAWEKMAARDPYFYPFEFAFEFRDVVVPLYRVVDGVRTSEVVRHGPVKRLTLVKRTFSPSPRDAEILASHTGSQYAIVRGEWFLSQVGRNVEDSYFELRGIPKTEAEFCAEFGVDPTAAAGIQAELGANIQHSPVTEKERRFSTRGTPHGSQLMLTRDPARNDDPQRSPIRNPTNFVFDGTEGFARGNNGVQAFWTADGKGNRVSVVPETIAPHDYTLPKGAARRVIVAPLSCVACHNMTPTERGYKSLENDGLNFLLGQEAIQHKDPVGASDVQRFYQADLASRITFERQQYAAAIESATGVSPYRAARAWLGSVIDYEHRPVTQAKAALDLGVSIDYAKDRFAAYAAAYPEEVQPNIHAFSTILKGAEIDRAAWELSYGFAWRVVHTQ